MHFRWLAGILNHQQYHWFWLGFLACSLTSLEGRGEFDTLFFVNWFNTSLEKVVVPFQPQVTNLNMGRLWDVFFLGDFSQHTWPWPDRHFWVTCFFWWKITKLNDDLNVVIFTNLDIFNSSTGTPSSPKIVMDGIGDVPNIFPHGKMWFSSSNCNDLYIRIKEGCVE